MIGGSAGIGGSVIGGSAGIGGSVIGGSAGIGGSVASRFREAVFPRIPGIGGRSAELEREFEAARVRGYAAGHAEGMRVASEAAALVQEEAALVRDAERIDAARRLEQALAAVETAARALAEQELRLAVAGRQELARLAIELAEAVVGAALPGPAETVRRALAAVDAAEVREVRLNPTDLALLRDVLSENVVPAGVALVPDPSLAPGDAIAIVPHGSVDARIGTAFERARTALRERS